MHPDGRHLFVLPWAGQPANHLCVFDVETKALAGHIDSIHQTPADIVFTQDGRTAYVAHCDVSEGGVTVLDIRKLHLLAPEGGESLVAGSTYTISWETCASVDVEYIVIEYSTDSGQTWQEIDIVANSGTYEWNPVPAVDSNECLVRITDISNPTVTDTSEVFTIFQCRGPIIGDLSGDCYVDFKDLSILGLHWLDCGNPFDPDCGIRLPPPITDPITPDQPLAQEGK
jgi:DNA-binding beta-propeller fold protein YncE